MAFPTVGSPTASQQTGNSTTSNVTLPASIAAGDLVVAVIAADLGAGAMTWPSPWVKLAERIDTAHVMSVGYLIATGGETTVGVTHTTERSNHLAWRITGWHGTTPPEVSALANGNSNAPNSPSLTPSWGADDTLWLSLATWDDSAAPAVSTYPANYTDGQGTNVTASSAGRVAGAARSLNAASEDPGAFALSGAETWVAYTVAVRPAAAGGGSPVTVTPGVASLSLSALSPTVSVSDNKTVVPGVASLSLAAQTPTVTATANRTATPGVASLTLTTFTPSVNVGVNVVPGVASLTIAALAPTVTATNNQLVTVGVAALALTALTPTVTASDHKTATIGLATLALTAFAPTVTAGSTPVVPGTVTCSVTLLHTAVSSVGLSGHSATASLSVTATATASVQ